MADRAGQDIGISVANPLPAGRGYGTSTADIGAALFCCSQALQFNLTASEAAHIAVQVEPTDSTFFDGLALFDHRTGRFFQLLGEPPPATVVILDPGGTVDSEEFNVHDWREPLARKAQEHLRAFQLLQQGIAASDLLAIGEASTLSATCHQTILFSLLVEMALSLSKQLGAAGICRAHSGTIVGLIFSEEKDPEAIADYLSKHFAGTVQVRQASLVGGGPRSGEAFGRLADTLEPALDIRRLERSMAEGV